MNAAMEKVQKIDRSKYTEESLKALDDAVAAVEKGLKESEQDKVDAMAAAIEKALDGLKRNRQLTMIRRMIQRKMIQIRMT